MTEYAGNILMVVENLFPQDQRVRREALKLSENRHKISVICLSRKNQKKVEKWKDISIYRFPKLNIFDKTEIKEGETTARYKTLLRSFIGYSLEYLYFTVGSFFLSILVFFKEGFDVIHAHNPPDTIFLWASFYKLLGKKFVYDHHDLAPEMYL
ncbi:MAG: hypothetical protein ACFFBV_15955, partial [Promethearchaeota archaeon]